MKWYDNKRCIDDDTYRWHYECKFVYTDSARQDKHHLRKLGRRGIFQRDNDPKHTAETTLLSHITLLFTGVIP